METAVATSAKKPFVSPWAHAPGTPISEAWETHSGPVYSGPCDASPKLTPIRKVILKLSPRPPTEEPQKKINSKKSHLRETSSELPVVVSDVPLDIEQQLAKITNDYSSNGDSIQISRAIESLEPEFMKEIVAVREWLKSTGVDILKSSTCPTLKLSVARSLAMFLCNTSDYAGFSRPIELLFDFCALNCTPVSRCSKLVRYFSSALMNAPLDDALIMRLCTALSQALNSKDTQVDKPGIIKIMVSIPTHEAQEFFRHEILSAKAAEDQDYSYDALAFCLQHQHELMKKLECVDELAVKGALGSFSEDILKRLTASPAQAISVFSRILKGMPVALQKPGCFIGAVVAKHLLQLSIMILASDKIRLDVAARVSLVDAITCLCAFVRKTQPTKTETVCMHLPEEFPPSQEKIVVKSFANLYETTIASGAFVESSYLGIISDFLDSSLNNCLVILVRLASESQLQLKIKALRSLLTILQPNDPFVAKAGFIPFIISKLSDNSVSVRDICLEILGKCQNLEDQLALVKHLIPLLRDGSSNVQKRVIRMMREFLSIPLEIELEASIVANLMTVVKIEDDQISAMALKALKEQWLSKILQRSNDRQEIAQFVSLVVRIIRETPVHSDSIQVFFSKCTVDKDVPSATLRLLCCGTVDVLFENLISSIEKGSKDSVQFVLKAISVFVGQEQEYLVSHLRLLFELSKSDDMVTVDYALRLMKLAISGVDRAVVLQLQDCEQHLVSLILKGSEPVVKGAVDFFASYCRHIKGHMDVFESLCQRFCTFLESKKTVDLPPELVSPVCRALFTLGCLRKCQLEQIEALSNDEEKLLQLFFFYFNSSTSIVKFYAAQSIAFAITAAPKIALQQDIVQLVKVALQSTTTRTPFLEAFETLLQKPTETQKVSFDTSMQSSDINVSATLIQIFVLDIVETVFSCPQKEIQSTCLRILSSSLTLGLCHPHQVIPSIVSLTAVVDQEISSKAREAFESIIETHSSFLFSNYSNIVRGMYKVRKLAERSSAGGMSLENGQESLVAPLYEALRSKKAKRNDLTDVLLQEFQEASEKEYSRFILENIAWLPFKTLEEISGLFGQISEIALSSSSDILENQASQPSELDLSKAIGILTLRGFLATAYSLNNE